MNDPDHQEPVGIEGALIVELRPYRERRRTRSCAAGFLLGLLIALWVLPALAELADLAIDVFLVDTQPGPVERAAAYTNGGAGAGE